MCAIVLASDADYDRTLGGFIFASHHASGLAVGVGRHIGDGESFRFQSVSIERDNFVRRIGSRKSKRAALFIAVARGEGTLWRRTGIRRYPIGRLVGCG